MRVIRVSGVNFLSEVRRDFNISHDQHICTRYIWARHMRARVRRVYSYVRVYATLGQHCTIGKICMFIHRGHPIYKAMYSQRGISKLYFQLSNELNAL